MGEELKAASSPDLRLKISMTGGESNAPAQIRLIRNGQVVKRGVLSLPYEGVWKDAAPSQRGYYRLLVEVDAQHRLVSNPIFFNSGHSPNAEVATLKAEPLSAPEPDLLPATPPVAETPAPLLAPTEKYVEVTGRGVRLRKGPSTQFPVVGKADFGERLLFVRRTDVMLSGKAWIVIQKEGELAYVWEGLVKETD